MEYNELGQSMNLWNNYDWLIALLIHLSKQCGIGRVIICDREGKHNIKITVSGFFLFWICPLCEVLVAVLLHTYVEELCST